VSLEKRWLARKAEFMKEEVKKRKGAEALVPFVCLLLLSTQLSLRHYISLTYLLPQSLFSHILFPREKREAKERKCYGEATSVCLFPSLGKQTPEVNLWHTLVKEKIP